MGRAGALAAALMVVGVGCKKKHTIVRARDAAPPVALVERPVVTGVTYAGEVEPDDDLAHASALALGAGVQGTIAGDDDVDVYKLQVPAAGMVAIAVDGVDTLDLVVEVENAAGEVVARSDRGGDDVAEGMPNLGLTKGDWFVVVRPYVKKARRTRKPKHAPPDAGPVAVDDSIPYRLTARPVAPADLTEREPDDDNGAASELFLGDTVRGWIGWNDDVDVWKLSLEGLGQRNALDLDVAAEPGVTLTLEVLDGTGQSLLTRRGVKGGPVSVKSLAAAVADGQPPFHYVKLSGKRSNPIEPYSLHVTGRLLDLDEEAEPNDTPDKATPLRTGTTAASGTMHAAHVAGDVDWFGIDAGDDAAILDVTVDPPTGADITLTAQNADGRVLATADAGGAGVRERLSGVLIPAHGAVRIQVAVKPDKKDTGEPREYQLRWSVSPSDGVPMPPEETGTGGSPGGGGGP
jgi:hypothetical protein